MPKPSALVPVTMAGGDLRADEPICVVGFRALKDFHPALLADNLRRAGHEARSVELDLLPETRRDANALGLARAFDDAAFRGEVLRQVTARLGAGERVAFPAVLGIADPHAVWSALERGLGRQVFEVPTLPPSVPGMRLFAMLRDALTRAGGRIVLNNVVTGAERDGARVTALRAQVGLREERRGADWVVLATGGFAVGRAGARLALGGARGRARAAGRRRPRAGRGALPARLLRARTRWAAPGSPSTTGCGRSARTASGCSRTCSSRARRSPARSRGARSRATG